MAMTKTLTLALFAVGVASCATPLKAKSAVNDLLTASEPIIITQQRYTAGKVVFQPYPVPDSSITPDPEPLTEEHISGVDIPPEDAMATAVAWSKQYHDLSTTYDVLRGWVIGVRAGQQGIDAPPVLNEDIPNE